MQLRMLLHAQCMDAALSYTLAGVLLIVTALLAGRIRELPITTTMLYLAVGIVLGPVGFGFLHIDATEKESLLERVAELAVIVSLFSAGLKMRVPLTWGQWAIPLRLAFGSMVVTVGLITLVGMWILNLPLGAAVLLGAILAPTDPVLASDVQMAHAQDRDRLRFGLTAEAGLNDGAAFPFVMLGLGFLGLHEIGEGGWRWFAIDVLWAIPAGLGIGVLLGVLVAKLVLYLRRTRREALGRDEFIALGLLSSSYGVGLLAHSYGFLAAFAAGVALRTIERRHANDSPSPDMTAAGIEGKKDEIASSRETAPAYMAEAVLQFNEQIERLMEVLLVLILGAMVTREMISWEILILTGLLFFVIRPAAVFLGLIGSGTSVTGRRLIGWFGIRGIGSIYYLMYAVNHGVPSDLAAHLTALTLVTIVVSIILHGISVTPVMQWYERRLDHGAREIFPS